MSGILGCVERVDIVNTLVSTVQFGVKSGRSSSVSINVAREYKFGTSETAAIAAIPEPEPISKIVFPRKKLGFFIQLAAATPLPQQKAQ